MSTVGVAPVNLAVVALESLLVGVFLVLSGASLFLLARRERTLHPRHWVRHAITNPLLLSNVGMTCAVTVHWILTVYRSFQAFIYVDGGANPTLYFLTLDDPTYVAQNVMIDLAVFWFDSIMVYRAWTIWSHKLLPVLLPLLLLAAGGALCIITTIELARYDPEDGNYLQLAKWITSSIATTIVTELVCAGLLAWKLLRAHMRARSQRISLLWVLSILVESASIYIVWSIIYFAVYEQNTNVNFLFSNLWAVVAGIAFMLINVRVGAGWGANNAYTQSGPGSGSTDRSGPSRPSGSGVALSPARAFEMRAQVTVDTIIMEDGSETWAVGSTDKDDAYKPDVLPGSTVYSGTKSFA